MSSAYRDERQAALEQLDALRRENDDLRAENEWLRSFVEPSPLSQQHALAQYRGAVIAATLLLGGMTGASFIARTCPPREATQDIALGAVIEEAPQPTVPRGVSRWHVPIEVVPPPAQVPAVPEASETPSAPSTDLRDALLLHTQGCLGRVSGRVDVLVAVDGTARVLSTTVRPHEGGLRRRARRCVARAFRDVVLPYDTLVDPSRAHAVREANGAELHMFIGRGE